MAWELGGGRGSHGGSSGSWRHRRGWGVIFRLSYNLVVGFVACLVGEGKGLLSCGCAMDGFISIFLRYSQVRGAGADKYSLAGREEEIV